MKDELKIILRKLPQAMSKDTCYHGDVDNWYPTNPTAGHCAITAILIQEILGGEVCKTKVNRRSHYFNVLDDHTIVDATAEQFKYNKPNYSKFEVVSTKNMLKNKDTKERYQKFKSRYFNIA